MTAESTQSPMPASSADAAGGTAAGRVPHLASRSPQPGLPEAEIGGPFTVPRLLDSVAEELKSATQLLRETAEQFRAGADAPGNAISAQAAERVGAVGRALERLVHDLRDAAADTPSLAIETRAVDPQHVARDALKLCQPQAQTQGIGLYFHSRSARPRLDTDGRRLQQILLNLLSNALTITSKGYVHVTLEDVDDMVEFRVEDTSLERVTPGDMAAPQGEYLPSAPGFGLRFYIAARLARALNGSAGFSCIPGQGYSCWVRLPAYPTPPMAAARV